MKNNTNQSRVIATVVKGNYSKFLSVFLYSLKVNFKNKPITVCILYDDISVEILMRFSSLVKGELIDLQWISMGDAVKITPRLAEIEDAHYWRIFLPSLLKHYEKIVYFDVDIMFSQDFVELFEIDLDSNTIGAVVDYIPVVGEAVSNYERLGLNPQAPYFNSGMMLIDVQKFLDGNVAQRVLKSTEENKEFLRAQGKWEQFDQYSLNVVLYENWKILPEIYNFGSIKLPIDVDPKVVHFIGGGKPDEELCLTKFKSEFYGYTRMAQSILELS